MEQMLDIHEFSGTMTYETNMGLETIDFAYNLMISPEGDEDLVELAAKAIAQFIVEEHIDHGIASSVATYN